jgi:hypothetical protein
MRFRADYLSKTGLIDPTAPDTFFSQGLVDSD